MKRLLLVTVGLLFSACAPKIYVIDRQTVLEEEAAGDWPQFEKDVIERAKKQGPTPLSKVPENARRKRLYSVLHGELTLAPPVIPASPTKPDGAKK